ncbi:MAG: tRNA-binding protein [Clostridiales bacterium]|nr:tRNA-binding protein [Clostridiales bacterium]
MINIEDFQKIDMRAGTIIAAEINKGARKPAYKLKVDFGDEIGIKNSSAQLTQIYSPADLIGRQVIAVVNFPPIRISQVKSEVLILGAGTAGGVVLLSAERPVENGSKIF